MSFSVSLDPDEEISEPEIFVGLLNFLDNDLTSEERCNFFNKTLPNMINRALNLKKWKPRGGLHFSLQQQPDLTELDYNFASSLIANAFFSTFPNRSEKTHPTLQNFNFTHFFRYLHFNCQKAKLRSIFYYFDWLEENGNSEGTVRILRQVMSSREWLTIEDWLECTLPLCPLQIKHEGRLERCDKNCLQICFCSSRMGGDVLKNGLTQECSSFVTMPELLSMLLTVEALEDNETVMVERVRHITRITDPKNKAILEKIEMPFQTSVSFMDADDYTLLPIGQYEEDNILRELNKCLLAFQQKQFKNEPQPAPTLSQMHIQRQRRLSPIGESVGSSDNSESKNIPLIMHQSCSTRSSSIISTKSIDYSNMDRLVAFENDRNFERRKQMSKEGVFNNRKGRFIVLGSSGECLPVKRKESSSVYSSCNSSDDEFHSAKGSFDEEDEEQQNNRRYSNDLDTIERRNTFAQRLRDALRRNASAVTSSTESSYAVGISVAGSDIQDKDIKVKRGGSTGFALKEDSLDENFLNESLNQEKQWINKFKSKQSALSKKDSSKSSEYSFSTDVSSELEEVYEQFSRWLDDPILETDSGTKRQLNGRELAVVQFAGSLLKRTLSETFAGVPLEEGENTTVNKSALKQNKTVLNARSLSLELARHKHKLASQLKKNPSFNNEELLSRKEPDLTVKKRACVAWDISYVTEMVQTLKEVTVSLILRPKNEMSQICSSPTPGLKPVATGNWGCGSSRSGEVQLKVIIQWLAASVAGVPSLTYYTFGHAKLTKLDTVCRILIDRKWTVKDLVEATLQYASHVLLGRSVNGTLFEDLIGVERS
ncbi:uncharacterized protein LOC108745068 isoform X2 [Agrilus planipennis]|uniref:poly(ADP-ribose) glycohydrolase n=1 Tax=Agrilus planipennis TaxID=224129 RepID=A0A1W4XKW2_AGRPL|nr:uncharacterized protein LOC108745068 isoform X2 [Agrilus planipennis]